MFGESLGECLGFASAAGDGAAAELFGFGVGDVEFTCSFTGVGVGDSDGCAFSFRDFFARYVGDADYLACHLLAE
jgi:hypothetical protein